MANRCNWRRSFNSERDERLQEPSPAGIGKTREAEMAATMQQIRAGMRTVSPEPQRRGPMAALGRALVALGRRLEGPMSAPSLAPMVKMPSQAAIESKLAAEAALQSVGDDRFASLASMIPGVVYQRVIKPDGSIRYTYLSEGAREMFGVSPEEVMEDPEVLFRTYSDEYKASFKQRLKEASKTMKQWDVEASIVRADGSVKYTHAIAKPERLADGSVLWTGLILDATRIKEAEEDLKAANRSVEAANKAKSLFLANMSHEIRTPMNGVFGMTDLLMRTDLTERQQRLVNTINQSAKSLLTIINDVLDVSRIEAGKLVLDRDSFDLRRSVEETVDLLAEAAHKKGLDLSLYIAPDVPARLAGDVGRIRQICTNIISNAIKFTNVGEVAITVACVGRENGDAHIELRVRDTGIGISREVQDRLFQPFEQADTSISRRFGGTGLGLAISKHLVGMMGGSITLASEAGLGSEFVLSLPLEIVAEAEPEGVQVAASLEGERVLVLDDRAVNREIIASYLREGRADVTCVETPEAALNALRAAERSGRAFSIAIIDMVLPGCSGLEVADEIKADPAIAGVKLMMVTSLNWKGDTQIARDHGFQAFLTKPVHQRELITTATRVLAQKEFGLLPRPAPAALLVTRDKAEGGTRVLVAEDNPVNVEVAREYLGNLNCAITQANNGLEAVAAFCEPRFDVILMDCQMPEMDGLAATRRIREAEAALGMARTPIIAVTANAYEEDRTRCLAAGMDDFLTKPFTQEQLEQRLAHWIKKPASVVVPVEMQPADAPVAPAAAPVGAVEPTKGPAHEVLDAEMLERLRKTHPALFTRLIETYVRIAPALVKTLRDAAREGNLEVLKTTAHSLKSSTANVGGVTASGLCRDLEMLLKSTPAAAVETWRPMVDAIDAELAQVIAQLAELGRAAAAA